MLILSQRSYRLKAHALIGRQPGAARLDRDAVGDDEAEQCHRPCADQDGISTQQRRREPHPRRGVHGSEGEQREEHDEVVLKT